MLLDQTLHNGGGPKAFDESLARAALLQHIAPLLEHVALRGCRLAGDAQHLLWAWVPTRGCELAARLSPFDWEKNAREKNQKLLFDCMRPTCRLKAD